ncbi:myo-inosose-2 dehydratase [Shimia sp.]|uniref:myo-inosose-2 dehydratase n=1 Tax=Shimia sp. TaxID=1954381 RepID=UPI003299132F
MALKFATNPIGWTNDDLPDLGKETTLEQCLSEARAAGYEGIEMGGKFPQDAAALNTLLGAHDLNLASGWWEGKILDRGVDAEFEAMQDYLQMLITLGVKHFVYGEGSCGRLEGIWKPISQRPVLAETEWESYAAALSTLADRTEALGINLALHPHMGTIVETDAEIDRVMQLVGPSVKLAFDTGHCTFAGGDPVAVCAKHADRIVHLHCKDIRTDKLNKAVSTDMSFMDAILDGIFTVPGDGGVDFGAILSSLQQANFDGWLVVEAEQNPEKAPPFFYAKLGFENLSTLAAEAGFAA